MCVCKTAALVTGLATFGHEHLPQDELRVLQLGLEAMDHVPQGVLSDVHRLATVDGTAVSVRELDNPSLTLLYDSSSVSVGGGRRILLSATFEMTTLLFSGWIG